MSSPVIQPDPDQPVPATVTGVQLMQGIGHVPPQGFWADAWGQVTCRPGAVLGLVWVGIVAFFAVFAPLLASGHPWVLSETLADGSMRTTFPLARMLTAVDVILVLAGVLGPAWVLIGRSGRGGRVGSLLVWIISALSAAVVGGIVQKLAGASEPGPWLRLVRDHPGPASVWVSLGALLAGVAFIGGVCVLVGRWRTLPGVVLACAVGAACVWGTWGRPLESFSYHRREMSGQARAVYTLIPFSPNQVYSELSRVDPGTTLGQGLKLGEGAPGAERSFVLGTDAYGQDVLSQMLHASRLSISIGVVSTGLALLIGVTLGAIMGYFGGWVDLLLYRVVEIFQAVPVLFLLLVAVSVLPVEWRSTYVMMAVIGCFSWTGMAQFTRAEFMRLRNQDFVQAAKAMGLPLRSILFRHMLPNGVAPVLVSTSFAVAAAIIIEATLSFLNLGPIDQASWGKLLASARSAEGEFKWWLAVFPGLAIFLTVLSYNLIGEAFRDAIDPKLKKARV